MIANQDKAVTKRGGFILPKFKEVTMKETFNQCYNKPDVSGDGAGKGPVGYYFINVPMAVCLPLRSCITKKRVAQQSLNIQFPAHK